MKIKLDAPQKDDFFDEIQKEKKAAILQNLLNVYIVSMDDFYNDNSCQASMDMATSIHIMLCREISILVCQNMGLEKEDFVNYWDKASKIVREELINPILYERGKSIGMEH